MCHSPNCGGKNTLVCKMLLLLFFSRVDALLKPSLEVWLWVMHIPNPPSVAFSSFFGGISNIGKVIGKIGRLLTATAHPHPRRPPPLQKILNDLILYLNCISIADKNLLLINIEVNW